MKGPFTEAELAIIKRTNEMDLGEIVEHLSPLDLIRLKSGEGISLKMILKGKALLEIYAARARGEKTEHVTRSELNVLREEHENIAVKLMLIFMALKRRGLISDEDIEETAAEIRGEIPKGTDNVRSTNSKARTASRGGKRGRKPKEEA